MALLDQNGNVVVATIGNDDFVLTGNDQTIDLLGGDDALDIQGGTGNIVNGSDGSDTIDATDGGGTNTLNGGSGNDVIFANKTDTADGGAGRDIIYAGLNNDTLDGGLGRDRFVIATQELPTAPNIIKNFDTSLDVVNISFTGVTQPSDLDVTPSDGNTVISFDGTQIAILEGVTSTPTIEILPSGELTLNPSDINTAPVVTSESFFFKTGTQNGDVLGTVQAVDPDQDEITTYAITAGNDAGIYAISADGKITVPDITKLAPANLTISVTDELGAIGTGTINIQEDTGKPVVNSVGAPGLSIQEGSPNGTAPIPPTVIVQYPSKTLGDLDITIGNNPDNDGDGTPAFTIDTTATSQTLGQLIVQDSGDLIFSDATKQFTLNITATDKQDGTKTDSGDVLINITEKPPEFSLDIDGDGKFLTNDGLLALRFLAFRGTGGLNDNLINGIVGQGARLNTTSELNQYLTENLNSLDIDGDSKFLTNDGLLALRFLAFRGTGGLNDNLISGIVGQGAQRDNATELNTQLQSFIVDNTFAV